MALAGNAMALDSLTWKVARLYLCSNEPLKRQRGDGAMRTTILASLIVLSGIGIAAAQDKAPTADEIART